MPDPSICAFDDEAILSPAELWDRMSAEARDSLVREPMMAGFMGKTILAHAGLESALADLLAGALAEGSVPAADLAHRCHTAYAADPALVMTAAADLQAVYARDPATRRLLQPFLYFKGFRAIQAHRLAHWALRNGQTDLALFLQMRVSDLWSVDIHPAARIGRGLMIDHAHGVVVGETTVVGRNVTLLHAVTLGGTGKGDRKRHPTIGNDVIIGAGAKVLGNIRIGRGAKIAAGSVVLRDVPEERTVAGVPGRLVGPREAALVDAALVHAAFAAPHGTEAHAPS